jgi:hypothetical protein
MRFVLALLIFFVAGTTAFAADDRAPATASVATAHAANTRTANTRAAEAHATDAHSTDTRADRRADTRLMTMLRGLDPATRFDQACGSEAMFRIKKEVTNYRPDRAVTSAVSEVKVQGDTMEGAGGAFRSRGKWYQFSFTCKASPDHMKVTFFSYKIGTAIPEAKWDEYGLWH